MHKQDLCSLRDYSDRFPSTLKKSLRKIISMETHTGTSLPETALSLVAMEMLSINNDLLDYLLSLKNLRRALQTVANKTLESFLKIVTSHSSDKGLRSWKQKGCGQEHIEQSWGKTTRAVHLENIKSSSFFFFLYSGINREEASRKHSTSMN